MADKEILRTIEVEIIVGESSSVPATGERSTIDGAEIDMGTIKGVPNDDLVGSGKPDPPTY